VVTFLNSIIRTNEITIKYVDAKSAAGIARDSTMLTTNGGIVVALPITRNVAPVSPKERVNDRITPAKIPLFNNGRDTDSAVLY
jgi:hypothetical protein